MDAVITLIEDYGVTAIIVIILFAVAVKQVVEFYSWAKGKLDAWRNAENSKDEQQESVEDRLTRLENHDNWQYEKINDVAESIEDIKELLVQSQDKQDEAAVAMCRALLKNIADDALEKGYLTTIEFETFSALTDVYLFRKGNHYMKDFLIPQVLKLPVKES